MYGALGCEVERVPGGRQLSTRSSSEIATGASLTATGLGVGLQPRPDEAVEVAVEHALGAADLEVGAVVLDHRVRVQHVGADLRAEVDVLRLAALARDLLLALALLPLDQLRA